MSVSGILLTPFFIKEYTLGLKRTMWKCSLYSLTTLLQESMIKGSESNSLSVMLSIWGTKYSLFLSLIIDNIISVVCST